MASSTTRLAVSRLALAAVVLGLCSAFAEAGPREHEMALDRWMKLKEAERFQLNSAERLYRENQFKAAADEYEKFLKLYEKSEGAAYAQLKYSHCLVSLRKQNAAIKDGYQSLLDYFPDSPEAPIASILIAQTLRDMGDIKPAKKAYAKVISTYPNHVASVWARLDLAALADKEGDAETRVNLLRQLTYDVERKGLTTQPCAEAATLFTQLMFQAGNFDEGLKALGTTYKDVHSSYLVNVGHIHVALPALVASKDDATKKKGEQLADAAAAWLKTQVTANLKDEKTKPQAIQAWYYIADVRAYAAQSDKQKAVYEEIIATLGPDDGTLSRLAAWYKTAGQREQARATYARYKDAIEGQNQIAHSYEEPAENPPKYDKAIEIYRKLSLDPKTAPTWLVKVATVYRNSARPDLAIAVYRELLTSDAKNADGYHIAIADTLYGAQRWKECITAYRGTNNFPTNYQHMAWANRQLKQFDEAIVLYRQIIAGTMDKNLAAATLMEIGHTQEAQGKKEDAIKTFKLICDKYPTTGSGSQAHSRLNEVYKIPVTLGGAKD